MKYFMVLILSISCLVNYALHLQKDLLFASLQHPDLTAASLEQSKLSEEPQEESSDEEDDSMFYGWDLSDPKTYELYEKVKLERKIKSLKPGLSLLEPHNPHYRSPFRGKVQTSFSHEGEDPRIVHPVAIPDSAVKALILDKEAMPDFLNCLKYDEKVTVEALKRIIQTELIASEIDLNDDGLMDLIAIENLGGTCSFGASNGAFWALLNSPKGYKVIMATQGAGFDVLKTKTNGVKNIRLTFVGGGEFNESRLVFNGKKYVLKRAKRH